MTPRMRYAGMRSQQALVQFCMRPDVAYKTLDTMIQGDNSRAV